MICCLRLHSIQMRSDWYASLEQKEVGLDAIVAVETAAALPGPPQEEEAEEEGCLEEAFSFLATRLTLSVRRSEAVRARRVRVPLPPPPPSEPPPAPCRGTSIAPLFALRPCVAAPRMRQGPCPIA